MMTVVTVVEVIRRKEGQKQDKRIDRSPEIGERWTREGERQKEG